MKKLFSIGLTAGLLGMGCGPADPQLDASTQALTRVTSKSTPQDLFRGLFFGRGPVAAKLPQIWAKGNPGAPKPPPTPSNLEAAKQLDAETAALAKAGLSADNQKSLRVVSDALRKDTLTPDQLARQVAVDVAAEAKAPPTDAEVTRVMEVIAKNDSTFFSRFAAQIVSGDPAQVASAVDAASVQLINASAHPAYRKGETPPADGFAAGLGACLDVDLATVSMAAIITMEDVSSATSVWTNNFVIFDFITDIARIIVANSFGNSSDALRHEEWMKIIAVDLQG